MFFIIIFRSSYFPMTKQYIFVKCMKNIACCYQLCIHSTENRWIGGMRNMKEVTNVIQDRQYVIVMSDCKNHGRSILFTAKYILTLKYRNC